MIDRRAFIAMMGGSVGGTRFSAGAQEARKVARIGYVSTNVAGNQHLIEAFRQGLRDLGYLEGRNLVIEYRSAEGKLERFPALAAELVSLNVDVIVAANTQAALAGKQKTATIPIVFAGPADPISSGLVTSLARPGGNVTGLSSLPTPQLVGKSLELLTQAVPGRTRIAALWHRDLPEHTRQDILAAVDGAGRALGVHLELVEAHGGPENFVRTFSELRMARAEALTVLTSVLFASATTPCGPGGHAPASGDVSGERLR